MFCRLVFAMVSMASLASVAGAQMVGSLTFDPPHIGPGSDTEGRVTLTAPAPAGGAKVKLSSNNPNFTVPAFVRVGAGKTTATFKAHAGNVGNFWGMTSADWNRVVKSRVRVSDTYDPWNESESDSTSGAQGNGDSGEVDPENDGDGRRISADGRFIVFSSLATNLVAGDRNRKRDVFLRDRTLGTTIRVSQEADGTEFTGDSWNPSISANGAFVVFERIGPSGLRHIGIWEAATRGTSSISQAANDDSFSPSISGDGRFVAFASYASNLVLADTNSSCDLFVWKRADGSM